MKGLNKRLACLKYRLLQGSTCRLSFVRAVPKLFLSAGGVAAILTRLKSQVGTSHAAAMVGDTWSQTSSLVSNERQLVLQLRTPADNPFWRRSTSRHRSARV